MARTALARAVTGYVEHQFRTGEDPFSVIRWAQSLSRPALRAAAFAGIARASGTIGRAADTAARKSNHSISIEVTSCSL